MSSLVGGRAARSAPKIAGVSGGPNVYVLFIAITLSIGIWLIVRGRGTRRRGLTWCGYALVVSVPVLFALMSFWAEMLWFDALGFGRRFWILMAARAGAAMVGGAAASALGYLLALRSGPHLRRVVAGFAAAAGVVWGLASWQAALLFLFGVPGGVDDPMLGLDVGFYLFTLPLLDSVVALIVFVAVVAMLAAWFVWEPTDPARGGIRLRQVSEPQGDPLVLPLASFGLAVGVVCTLVLRIFHLLYSDWGVVLGPGWVDVHVRYPALVVTAIGFAIAAVLPLSGAFRRWAGGVFGRFVRLGRPAAVAALAGWSGAAALAFLAVLVVPGLVQWLVVKPNEITYEKPYIANNIDFTRRGFKLHEIEERAFSPSPNLGRARLDANRNLLSEVRLWDWRALDAVYKQFQEIRLYYEFADVDIDRYHIGDRYRQVMVSARELAYRNLPARSQTFVNGRFKYTHGHGVTLATVTDFTREGLPNLLIRDIPPVAEAPELEIDRPEIYYGELTREHVFVNTREPEFDFPSGESNAFTRYSGRGGVQLSSLWRSLIYGWKFDGTVFLLSGYPTADSRVLFHRQVQDRVARIAPFLELDEDPYITVVDGRLYWIIDAYTRSSYYPYSQPFDSAELINYREGDVGVRSVARLNGMNYVRNPVKAVVDAYDGTVSLYVFDDEDPVIRTWRRVLPGVFRDAGDMPAGVRRHVRYPLDFLLAQGLIFTRYHMTDPAVFYNQEDLWVRATEKHYHTIQPVEPYYVMWELPGSDEAEFVLILPFTPKNRQVLIGWIAGLSDGDNYGRFLAYKFPKEKRVLGPQQVETKIDQDPFLSGQLTLWDQQGSEVIRGNVLAIPMDDTLLYVEPIYLQAETAAYPELRLVAVMHGDRLSYAPTFDEALLGLIEGSDRGTGEESNATLALLAKRAFDQYQAAIGEGRFETAGEHLRELADLLERLSSPAQQTGIR